MFIQYTTKTKDSTDDLINCGLDGENGLITSGQKITAGLPDVTADKFIPGAIIQNKVDQEVYVNIGSTVAPKWDPVSTGVYTITGTLTPAEIVDLLANPVQVLPAPGVGVAYAVDTVQATLDFNTTPYVTQPGNKSSMDLKTDTTSWASVQTVFIESIETISALLVSISPGGGFILKDNEPMMWVNPGLGDVTMGDSNIDYLIKYRILPIDIV